MFEVKHTGGQMILVSSKLITWWSGVPYKLLPLTHNLFYEFLWCFYSKATFFLITIIINSYSLKMKPLSN